MFSNQANNSATPNFTDVYQLWHQRLETISSLQGPFSPTQVVDLLKVAAERPLVADNQAGGLSGYSYFVCDAADKKIATLDAETFRAAILYLFNAPNAGSEEVKGLALLRYSRCDPNGAMYVIGRFALHSKRSKGYLGEVVAQILVQQNRPNLVLELLKSDKTAVVGKCLSCISDAISSFDAEGEALSPYYAPEFMEQYGRLLAEHHDKANSFNTVSCAEHNMIVYSLKRIFSALAANLGY